MLETTEERDVLDREHALISSARVEGTPIFDPEGSKLGSVHSLMIHKTTGQVAYALLQFGGFMGLGSHVHPVPWAMLTYDPERGGYTTAITRANLAEAPALTLDEASRPRETERRMYDYWELTPYW